MAEVREKCEASSSIPILKPRNIFEIEDIGEFDYVSGCKATPLVQVFSVHISTDLDDEKPYKIYGSIRALEGPYPCFDLYHRDPDDSETIWKDGTLSLIGPVGGAIVPSLKTSLDICLNDRIRGVEVVKGELNLDPMTEDSYDTLLKGVVEGAHGSAYVYYTIFKFAVYGSLKVTVNTYDDVDGAYKAEAADIYGSIVVGYENGRRYCTTDEEVKFLETRVFDKSSHQPLRVLIGKPITFSRNVVAVPAYSTLKIQLNLWDSIGKIAGECLRFPAHFTRSKPFYIQTQHAYVAVDVRWYNAYLHIYKGRKVEDVQKKQPRVLQDQPLPASLVPRAIPSKKNICYRGIEGTEIFTISVEGINGKISALCGTIEIDDGFDLFIYKKHESCYETLLDHGLASIEFNYRAIYSTDLYIILNLRDPVSKLEVSKGEVCWSVFNLRSNMSWENKQLCSIVRGRDGYAAVHYALFDNAFEATVEVKLFRDSRPDIPIISYGTLIASNSGYDYSTSYQKKYYKSRLLDWPRDRSVELESGSKIAMLKSKVLVPSGSSLIIEADFFALGIDDAYEAISGTVEFEIDLCGSSTEVIRGEHQWMEIYVTFKNTPLDGNLCNI